MEYEDTKDTIKLREQLQSFNQFISQQELTYIDQETGKEIKPHGLYLKYMRKFRNNFTSGGRLYSAVQHIRKEERRTIKLNGQPTVELDFKSMHLRLLYNMSGLESPWDCYNFGKMPRETAKILALICLNTSSKSSALKALRDKLRDKPYDDIKALLQAFMEAHKPLEQYFFKETWSQLHYWDSTIAFNVMRTFQAEGIPIIAVHDSFVVPETEEDRLYQEMIKRYVELAQFEPVISKE